MESKDFKVVDKRRFSETGETKAEAEKAEKKEEKVEKPQDAPKSAPLPPVDFSTFMLSLSNSALLHLGEIPHQETNKVERNLELARHTIDMIDMLKQKTKGNLTGEEAMLLDNILYDLRMRYVKLK